MVSLGVVGCVIDPSTRRQRQADLCEFKATLVYKVTFRTARTATKRTPVSKKKIGPHLVQTGLKLTIITST